jgi:MoxR-like ATPase
MTDLSPTPRIHRAQMSSDRLRPQADMDRRHESSPTNGFAARDGCGLAVPQLRGVLGPESSAVSHPVLTVADVAALTDRLRANVLRGVHLPAHVLEVVLATLLAGGHLLLEDYPGVGKTQLARTLASSFASSFARVQGTVDLLPSDIVGASIWRPEVGSFEFRPGPVFAHLLLVDELNRATPKTQSGLLEAMQERQVTVDGASRPLPSPFIVIATQNPAAGYDGTYALPLAQLDRFLARVSLGYPSAEQEMSLLSGGLSPVAAVSSPHELRAAQRAVRGVHTSQALVRYVVALLAATREHPLVEVGASPRAGLLLVSAARALAAVDGRDFVVPDDIQAMAPAVLQHRLQLVASAPIDGAEDAVADVLATVSAR